MLQTVNTTMSAFPFFAPLTCTRVQLVLLKARNQLSSSLPPCRVRLTARKFGNFCLAVLIRSSKQYHSQILYDNTLYFWPLPLNNAFQPSTEGGPFFRLGKFYFVTLFSPAKSSSSKYLKCSTVLDAGLCIGCEKMCLH